MSVIRYFVENMRVNPPSEKVAEKNPDRAFTVNGTAFYTVDEKGKAGAKMSIASKVIDKDTAKSPEFRIDLETGSLVLPEGRRGRTANAGISQSELDSLLESLK